MTTAASQRADPSQLSARERILTAADRLFYKDGFRAVGIDTIIAEAGVAKMTLYRHFPSKDDLIVAYLEKTNEIFWDRLDQQTEPLSDPIDQLIAIFKDTEQFASNPRNLGCTFQAIVSDFPDPDHPGHQIAISHKLAVRERFADIARQANLSEPSELANQLLLLLDGAMASVRIFGPGDSATGLTDAAETLIGSRKP